MRGFWVDERIDGNIWNLKNPLFKMIYNYFKRQEIKFFSNADYTISLTYNGKDEIHSWKNIAHQPIPIQVIPCCVDTSKFNNQLLDNNKLTEFKNNFKITSDDLVISYVGSIGTWYMVDEMMCFFKELKNEFSNAKFLFITTSAKEEILEYATKHQVDIDSLIITSGKRDQMPYLISLSNFSLFFIKPLFSKKASSPTKQAEIMSLGIPIICNDLVGDTARIIDQYNAGFVLKEFNKQSYLKIINQLKNTVFNSEEIRKGAIEFYDLEMGVNRYEEVYTSLVK
jgi:glycosyltransferase involved in cell wall biosynthesis